MFTAGGVHSLGFDKCVLTCIPCYHTTQDSLTALTIVCALATHPSLPTKHWHMISVISTVLLLPECHIVGLILQSFQTGFLHLAICI